MYSASEPLEPRLLFSAAPVDSFTYTISDGRGGESTATVLIYNVPACDATLDGRVDRDDLAVWQANYDPRGLRAAERRGFVDGDFNGDGRVNLADLAYWQRTTDMVRLARPMLVYESPTEPGVWLAAPLTLLSLTLNLTL